MDSLNVFVDFLACFISGDYAYACLDGSMAWISKDLKTEPFGTFVNSDFNISNVTFCKTSLLRGCYNNDPEQAQRDKDMQNNLALIANYFKKIYKTTNNNLRTTSNSKNKNVHTTPRFKNDNQSGQFGNQRTEYRHFAKECRKPKRVKDSAYHKEKMLLCKQAEQGVPLQAEQYDWLTDTNEEVDEQ
uniref:Uncharacterized protein n=1 Tax=Tanacetum cinerariifolium TaxID=118510 RepID=A0A699IUY3_TANCI|nr:hypothetical protein [Tanacetum cinerariifolium]